MIDYSLGKIYTIRCKSDDSLIYVGSTVQKLSMRWGGHKNTAKKHPSWDLFVAINNKWHKWYIELYEDFPCKSREELHKREGEITRLIGTLNMIIAGRTKQEREKKYYEEKKYQNTLKFLNEYVLKHKTTI